MHTHVNGSPPAATASSRPPVARFELTKPVRGYRDTHSAVELREPTVGDYLECGDIDISTFAAAGGSGSVTVTTDVVALGRWFERLSGLPMSAIQQMALDDGRKVMAEIRRLVRVGGVDSKN